MKRTTLAVIAVVLLAGLAGCIGGGDSGPEPSENTDASTQGEIVYENPPEGDGVIRFVDSEAGVVCYVFARGDGYDGQGGLSCVPIEDTNFAEE